MKRVILAALAIVVSGCSKPPAPAYHPPAPTFTPVTPAASTTRPKMTKERAEAWTECAFSKAREFDDGRSDAATIAAPVRSACRSLYGYDDNEDLQVAIEVVLRSRAAEAQLKQAITPAWVACVDRLLQTDGVSRHPVGTVAVVVAAGCKPHFRGKEGQDIQIITSVVEKERARPSSGEPVVVGPPQPMAPAERRM